jgi:hypothetical protein
MINDRLYQQHEVDNGTGDPVDEDEGSPEMGIIPVKYGRKSKNQRKPSGSTTSRFLSLLKVNAAYKNCG